MGGSHKVIVSTVSTEFAAARRALADLAQRPNLNVEVQEDFTVLGGTTLDKLDEYVRHCAAVVHLVGRATGAFVPAAAVTDLTRKHPDLTARLPFLVRRDFDISYTQWEAYLALYHRRPLFIYVAEDLGDDSPSARVERDVGFLDRPAELASQRAHLDRIRRLGRDRGRFAGRPALIAEILVGLADILAAIDPPAFEPRAAVRTHAADLARQLTRKLAARHLAEPGEYVLRHVRRLGQADERMAFEDVRSFLRRTDGFLLFGEPGAGKTATFFSGALKLARAAVDDLDQATVGEPVVVPIAIEAREVGAAVRGFLRDQPGGDVEAHLSGWLRARVLGPFFGPAEDMTDVAFVDRCRQMKVRPTLMVEAFDELVQPPGLAAPLTDALVMALQTQQAALGLALVVSSRFKQRNTLQALQLEEFELVPLSSDEVGDYVSAYVAARAGTLQVPADDVIRTFRDACELRPLYLRPLIEYFSHPGVRPAAPPSRAGLLRTLIRRAMDDSPDPAVSGGDRLAAWAACRELAAALVGAPTVGAEQIDAAAGQAFGGPADPRARALTGCLRRLLIEVDEGEFQFLHPEYRDYLLADGLVAWLTSGAGAGEYLLAVHQAPEVLGWLEWSFADVPERRRREAFGRLADALGPAAARPVLPPTRHSRDVPAAALAVLVRLFPPDRRPAPVDASGRCFQGLPGADADFRGVDLHGSVLREADLSGATLDDVSLTGCDLDTADLTGASLRRADLGAACLRNAHLGRLDRRGERGWARGGLPTDLTGARLAGSDWFNARIRHAGYLQLWTTRVLAGGRASLSSTSQGSLWLTRWDAAAPVELRTDPPSAVIGFDLDPERGLLVMTCRDGTVRSYRADVAADGGSVRLSAPAVRLRTGSEKYFTRTRLGRWWACVGDRIGGVRMLPVADLLDDPANPLESTPVAGHDGAVVFVERTADGPGGDRFLTGGYDGRVLVHHEAAGRWASTVLVDLPRQHPGPRREPIVRAILPDPGAGAATFWVGGECGRLFRVGTGERVGRPWLELPDEMMIFSLARSPDGRALAVGTDRGRILLYAVGPDGLASTGEFAVPCGDIVRTVEFLDGGAAVLAVSWAGLIRVWSVADRRATFDYDPGETFWRPEADAQHLVFDSADELTGIRGLSARYADYLKRLVRT